jgi:hypothetical protein
VVRWLFEARKRYGLSRAFWGMKMQFLGFRMNTFGRILVAYQYDGLV